MRGNDLSRRGFVGGLGAAILAAVAGRALSACGGGPVGIHIRRVDGSTQGDLTLVRASVALTNHTQQAQSVALRLTLNDASGAQIATETDSLPLSPAEVLCYCIEVPVSSYTGSMNGVTLTVTVGDESATSPLSAFGSNPIPGCDYTCNY